MKIYIFNLEEILNDICFMPPRAAEDAEFELISSEIKGEKNTEIPEIELHEA